MKKPLKLVTLASALAALSGAAGLMSAPADAKVTTPNISDAATADPANGPQPNVFIPVGQDLLGMVVKKKNRWHCGRRSLFAFLAFVPLIALFEPLAGGHGGVGGRI
jgi:hypothetical protein